MHMQTATAICTIWKSAWQGTARMIRDPRKKSVPRKSKWDVGRLDSLIIWKHFRSLQHFSFFNRNREKNTVSRYNETDLDGDGKEGNIA